MIYLKLKIFFIVLILLTVPVNYIYAAVPPDSGLLWLINRDNRLGKNYKPPGLKMYAGFKMHGAVIEPFKKMTAAMKADGLSGLFVQSAFRDYAHQQFLFSRKKSIYIRQGFGDEEAAAYASRSVTFPGASEHQSGLALDVTLDGMLNQSFGETAHGKWLEQNCHRFGFIIRYPQSKTEITNIIYEPWHLRYVGMPHSAYMKEKNLCLEEYIGYLEKNERNIFWIENGVSYYLITYTKNAPSVHGAHTDVSADRPVADPGYIFTDLKTLTGLKY